MRPSVVGQHAGTFCRGVVPFNESLPMQPQKKFQIVFSLVMGAMMVFIMTFVITAVNVGFSPDFLHRWATAFGIAYVVAVPVIFFVAPLARKITGRLLGMPV
ncbi:DUF2798 domain-containing protein [Curvibacter sp. APW13]|uniref:DUF2798 domain-containing protein n=1 Tax=Curvibacter sp. APW13 TaxID=3077236 RepID=UPI0028DD49ED|nr:DUF2798 domain-containing protein [Curvibacter sp. APW13]MDT8989632.1 DUF2798 domain-containing protein [Curvibacter sp. APW13]